jgi:hypothetical protein
VGELEQAERKGRGRGKGEEMTQTLYAHMNKRNLKKRKLVGISYDLKMHVPSDLFFAAKPTS